MDWVCRSMAWVRRSIACRARLAALLLAVALLPFSGARSAEDLGRLFLTPQQRQELERRRVTNAPAAAAAAVTLESLITINGQVSRAGGQNTTWVNGQPQTDLPAQRDPATVSLSPGEGEAAISLRVGQTLDRGKGEVLDGLNGGEVKAAARRAR